MTEHSPRPNQVEHEADLVQSALDRIAAGADADGVLAVCDAEVEGAVRLALALGATLPVKAPGRYKARLQVMLQAAMDRGEARPGLRRLGPPRLVVRLAGSALAVALILASAVAVSAEALPGDAFYGVKRAAEETRILLTVSPRGRAEARLSQAETRLDEVRQLVARGVAVSPEVVDALLDSHHRAEAVSQAAGGDVLLTAQLRAAEGVVALRALAEQADPTSRLRLMEAAEELALVASPATVEPVTPAPRGATSRAPVVSATATRGPGRPAGPAIQATATTASNPRPGVMASATASPSATPRTGATVTSSEPSLPGAPVTQAPATATPMPGVTQPARPVGTERAIRLTQQPRRTQAAPPTSDSSSGGAATPEATPGSGGPTPPPDPGAGGGESGRGG
ncbi:MAG: DUF5667 domain-containing protein [Anaerolineae bacterium]